MIPEITQTTQRGLHNMGRKKLCALIKVGSEIATNFKLLSLKDYHLQFFKF